MAVRLRRLVFFSLLNAMFADGNNIGIGVVRFVKLYFIIVQVKLSVRKVRIGIN